MPILKTVFNKTTKVVRVLDAGAATPSGFVHVGDFSHPDATYPDSVVIYHGVRDLLYLRSAADPAAPASFPNNITNMHDLSIENLSKPVLKFTTDLPPYSFANEGDDVSWAVVVAGGTAPYTYKWYWNEVLIDPLINATAATATLVNTDVTVESAGYHTVVVTDALNAVITSENNYLTVSEN